MCRKLTLKDKALHHDCDRGDGGGKPGALNNWWTGRNEGWQAEGQSSEEVDGGRPKKGRWSQVGRVKVEKGWRGVTKKQMQNILSKEGENENN